MRQRKYLAIAVLAALAGTAIPTKAYAHDHRSGPAAVIWSGGGFGVPSHARGSSGNGFRNSHFGQVFGQCAPRFRNPVLVNSARGPIFVTPSFGRFRTRNVVIVGGQSRRPAWVPTFGPRGYAPVHTRFFMD
jgi:hypothetical protein